MALPMALHTCSHAMRAAPIGDLPHHLHRPDRLDARRVRVAILARVYDEASFGPDVLDGVIKAFAGSDREAALDLAR